MQVGDNSVTESLRRAVTHIFPEYIYSIGPTPEGRPAPCKQPTDKYRAIYISSERLTVARNVHDSWNQENIKRHGMHRCGAILIYALLLQRGKDTGKEQRKFKEILLFIYEE